MNSKRQRMKRRKRIRNTLCITFCVILLLITVGIIRMLTNAIGNLNRMPESIDEMIENSTPPPKEPASEAAVDDEVLTICIDAGHGGKDIGSDSKGRIEKDDNLKLALAIQSYLEEQDVKVIMTRTDDTFLKLAKRCDIANQAGADYFVSVHRNKGNGNGVESWIYSQANAETEALATNIQDGLSDVGIQRDRGVKKGSQKSSAKDYFINSNAKMPSCIIELGFINVAEDNQLFDDNLKAYAKAIGKAILKTAQDYSDTHVKVPESTESLSDTEAVPSTEGISIVNTSHTITNPTIDINGLDTTILDWGQGSNVDEQNRPTGSVMYQEKYGKYNAYFISEGDKTIYLTFDEGYEVGYTPSILDTLKEKNVKAVFFVTQPYAKTDPELVSRMIDEGHMVGNHTVTHPSTGVPSLSVDKQQSEIVDNHNYIKDNFGGYEMHLFRYPAGKFSEQSLAILNNCNYKSVFWSFAYMDYDVNNQPNEAESLQKMIDKLHSGAIYLLHAESSTNTNVLGNFIDKARALGYEFALFD